jgi:hypothetical protein
VLTSRSGLQLLLVALHLLLLLLLLLYSLGLYAARRGRALLKAHLAMHTC